MGHIIGAILGTGGATVAELQITRALKDKHVSDEERALMHINYTMIRVGMGFVLVSAIAMFWYFWDDGLNSYLTSGKVLMKDLMFVAIFVNAILLTKRMVPLWLGASISFTSWWGASLLGAAGTIPYGFFTLFIGYIIAIFVVAALSHILRSISINHRMDGKTVVIALALLVAVVSFAYYQLTGSESARQTVVTESTKEATVQEALSATVDFDYPGGTHRVVFNIAVDDAGTITKVTAVDLDDPDNQDISNPYPVNVFAEKLTTVVAGKKLSELEAVDKVGISSLTTEAFNEGLEKIQQKI